MGPAMAGIAVAQCKGVKEVDPEAALGASKGSCATDGSRLW